MDGRAAPAPEAAAVLRILDALSFAAAAHANQRRKGAAQEPYVNHLIEVAGFVAEATDGADVTAIVAALLHDAVEDTPVTSEEIATRFGRDVADVVAELSDDMSLPKEARKAARIAAAPGKSPMARLVKAADVMSNLAATAKSPPAGWGCDRQAGYLQSCRELLAAMEGGHPRLAARAEALARDTEAAIRARSAPSAATIGAAVAQLDTARGEPVHLVYLPNTEAGPWGAAELDRLCGIVAERFPSATIQTAEGLYEGRRRPIFVLRLRTDETAAVVALAQRLCLAFGQRFVGIECGGRYIRVYADDTA